MNNDFSYYLSKYLKEYMIVERNFSSNTIKSYKNTFKLFIDYLVNIKGLKITDITFDNITREYVLDFLTYLENEKHNTIKTRNHRLAVIKSFYEFCLMYEVENISNIRKVLEIKCKKTTNKVIDYLTEEELKNVLNSVDTSTLKGRRDLTILSLMYDTAARSSEIINLKIEDINLETKTVILNGKGSKQRIVPISNNTRDLLKMYLKENILDYFLLCNNKKEKLNKWFLRDLLKKHIKIQNKNITPHTFRHTRAIHLLSVGVPLIYIRDLLGHTSISTTEIYAKVLEKNKFEAIEKATSTSIVNSPLEDWNDDQDLLNQLLNL